MSERSARGEGSGERAVERAGVLAWVPASLALVAEAAWIAVVAGLLQAFALRPPTLGIPAFAIAAAAGLVTARVLGPRTGRWWGLVAAALAVAMGLAGWLAAPEVREALASGAGAGAGAGAEPVGTSGSFLGAALGANPGGWLAWVAFVRGMSYAGLPVQAGKIGTLLVVAVPGLAIASLLGGMTAQPWRGMFLANAQVQVLVFLAAALPALAIARLAQVETGASIDWRRNPAWLVLLGLLLAVVAVVAAWLSVTAGPLIVITVATLIAPLLLLGLIVGFDRRSLRILGISALAAAVLYSFMRMFDAPADTTPGVSVPVPATSDPQTTAEVIAAGAPVLVILGAALVALVLARLWLKRSAPRPAPDDEVRVIDHGDDVDAGGRIVGRRRRGRATFTRRPAPTDAVTAYRALMEDLEGRDPVARRPGETPAEHAARLRATGHGALSLELLAADYGLAAFGGRPLTEREHRRAISRAAVLRRSLAGSRPTSRSAR